LPHLPAVLPDLARIGEARAAALVAGLALVAHDGPTLVALLVVRMVLVALLVITRMMVMVVMVMVVAAADTGHRGGDVAVLAKQGGQTANDRHGSQEAEEAAPGASTR
jgi:hypothetical protein